MADKYGNVTFLSDYIVLAIYGLLIVLAAIGYVMNFCKLLKSRRLTPLSVLRIAGVFVPFLGALIGYVPNRELVGGR